MPLADNLSDPGVPPQALFLFTLLWLGTSVIEECAPRDKSQISKDVRISATHETIVNG